MTHSRIDIIGQNGNDGLHYGETDVVERLEQSPRVGGALMQDIQDAIDEINRIRLALQTLYSAHKP